VLNQKIEEPKPEEIKFDGITEISATVDTTDNTKEATDITKETESLMETPDKKTTKRATPTKTRQNLPTHRWHFFEIPSLPKNQRTLTALVKKVPRCKLKDLILIEEKKEANTPEEQKKTEHLQKFLNSPGAKVKKEDLEILIGSSSTEATSSTANEITTPPSTKKRKSPTSAPSGSNKKVKK